MNALPELAARLVVVIGPLLIAEVLRREARLPRRAWEFIVTIAAAIAAIGIPTLFSVGLFVILFFVISVPRMKDAERALAVDDPGPKRSASLIPRQVSDVVPTRLRLIAPAILVAGAPLLAVRDMSFLALVFAGAAVTFCGLYELWMREEGEGPEGTRGARVQKILRLQIALVITMMAIALALVSVTPGSSARTIVHALAAAIGAPVGIIGCSYALLSGTRGATLPRPKPDPARDST